MDTLKRVALTLALASYVGLYVLSGVAYATGHTLDECCKVQNGCALRCCDGCKGDPADPGKFKLCETQQIPPCPNQSCKQDITYKCKNTSGTKQYADAACNEFQGTGCQPECKTYGGTS